MLQFFRNFFNSKVGVGLTLGLLGLIALAFASADVSNSGGFGGVAGGDRAATVGKARVNTAQLAQAATAALENLKQENPRLSMKAFLASGGLERVLNDIVDRTALAEFGREHSIVASDRLIDSEIAKIPAFRGPDGKFSDSAYRQALQQRGLSDKLVRADLGQGLVARQLLVPAAFGAVAPRELATRYAALLREHRNGAIGIPSTIRTATGSSGRNGAWCATPPSAKLRSSRPRRLRRQRSPPVTTHAKRILPRSKRAR
jgi:peptidyl-prolyl cis-trans isomerase D